MSDQERNQERKQFDEWRERFINETGFPPNEADAWQARAALSQQAVPASVSDAMHRAAMVYLAKARIPVPSAIVQGALQAALAAAPQAEQQGIPADFVREFQIERAWKLGYTYERDAEFVTHEDEAWGRRAADVIDEVESLAPQQARRESLTAQAPAVGDEPAQAFLCRAWGESDLPAAELVPDWDGVRAFMVREWTGSEDATADDGTNYLDELKEEFDRHEEDERGGPYEIRFEIGGVSVERVTGLASKPPVQPIGGEA